MPECLEGGTSLTLWINRVIYLAVWTSFPTRFCPPFCSKDCCSSWMDNFPPLCTQPWNQVESQLCFLKSAGPSLSLANGHPPYLDLLGVKDVSVEIIIIPLRCKWCFKSRFLSDGVLLFVAVRNFSRNGPQLKSWPPRYPPPREIRLPPLYYESFRS